MALSIDGTGNGTIGNLSVTTATGNIVSSGDSGTITAGMLNGGQTGSTPAFAVRAWVQFVASSGTPTIGASGNVSSITDDGVGKSIINFTTAFQDDDYATQFTAQDTVTNAGSANFAISQTTSSVAVWHFENGTYRDPGNSAVTIIR
jgi:hypothetical protein